MPIATSATPGGGFDVALDVERNLAVVVGDGRVRNTGSLSIVDFSDAANPAVVGQVDLPSRALGVSVSAENRLILVASGDGLVIVRY